jgi:hypothetical protein
MNKIQKTGQQNIVNGFTKPPGAFAYSDFGFVSDFEIRISDLVS